LYHLSILLVVEWILRHRLSFLSHQELPERLLLTYKTEEAEKGPEPVQIVEEKEKPQSVEEPRDKKLLAVAGSLRRFLQSLFPFTSFVYLSVGILLLGFTAGFKICLRLR